MGNALNASCYAVRVLEERIRRSLITIFLRGIKDRAEELDRLADLSTDILYDIGRLIHCHSMLARIGSGRR